MKRVELHLHTKLSDDISVITPKEAMEYAIKHSHKAVAFTNLNNVQDFPAIAKAYRQCGDSELKVIYGAELRYMGEGEKAPYGITVLAKNQSGIKELYKIISSIHFGGACEPASLEVIRQNRKNLLIGSCGNAGELYEAVASGKAPEKVAAFYDYFEIYPTNDETERKIYKEICNLGDKLGIPVAAVGNCKYLTRKDGLCRRVICAVNGYEDEPQKFFYHSTDEMLAEFSYLGEEAAYRSVVTDTNRIADLITQVAPLKEGFYPPVIKNAYQKVRKTAYKKAKEIYGDPLPSQIEERLETELTYIKKYDYAFHYWIAFQMVRYMNGLGYYAGARGAVGSVFVAFLLGVADTNPLPAHYRCDKCHYFDFEAGASDGFDLPKRNCPACGYPLQADGHDIPYETFMGSDGSKKPDIDLNFPVSKQLDEFAYLQKLFGEDRVAHAGTTSALPEKYAEGYVVVYECKTGDILTKEQRDYIGKKLCGTKWRGGIHPGGIVVLPRGTEFEDFMPIRNINSCSLIKKVTHFDFHSISDTVIKLDVLGYRMNDMFKRLEELTGTSVQSVDWNDPKVFELFEQADTAGIPGFENESVRRIILKANPKNFNDLVQISGLEHGMGTWIDNGENLTDSGHRLSELPALRDDVFLQLMKYGLNKGAAYQIAEYVRSGRLYHISDLTFEFVEYMRSKKVPEWYIESLRKIRYLFPKAHAVADVMNAVRIAWYRIHYPMQFRAVCLTSGDIGTDD